MIIDLARVTAPNRAISNIQNDIRQYLAYRKLNQGDAVETLTISGKAFDIIEKAFSKDIGKREEFILKFGDIELRKSNE